MSPYFGKVQIYVHIDKEYLSELQLLEENHAFSYKLPILGHKGDAPVSNFEDDVIYKAWC